MNKDANPLNYILNCCEQGLVPSTFDINNAKDELIKLRSKIDGFQILGWARINANGDPYDLRLYHNPHVDQNTVMPIYYDKNSYKLWKNGNKSK
jgi:hypothetical protein